MWQYSIWFWVVADFLYQDGLSRPTRLPPGSLFYLGLLPHYQCAMEYVKLNGFMELTASPFPGSRCTTLREAAYVAEQWLAVGMVARECPGLTQYWCQHRYHCQRPWQGQGLEVSADFLSQVQCTGQQRCGGPALQRRQAGGNQS